MSQISANTTPQTTRIPLQFIAVFIVVALLGVLYFAYPEGIFYLVIAFVSASFALNYAEKIRLQREAQARADAFATICGPVLITSNSPVETAEEVHARADEFREQLRLSGNPYAEEIPIVVEHYSPMLFKVGQLTAAWCLYQRLCGEKLHAENLLWAEKCPTQLRTIFLSQVMPAPEEETEKTAQK